MHMVRHKKKLCMLDKRDHYLTIRWKKFGRYTLSKNILSVHVVRYYFGITAEGA